MGVAVEDRIPVGGAFEDALLRGMAVGDKLAFSIPPDPTIISTSDIFLTTNLYEDFGNWYGVLTAVRLTAGNPATINFNKGVMVSYISESWIDINASSDATDIDFGTSLILDIDDNNSGVDREAFIELDGADGEVINLTINQNGS